MITLCALTTLVAAACSSDEASTAGSNDDTGGSAGASTGGAGDDTGGVTAGGEAGGGGTGGGTTGGTASGGTQGGASGAEAGGVGGASTAGAGTAGEGTAGEGTAGEGGSPALAVDCPLYSGDSCSGETPVCCAAKSSFTWTYGACLAEGASCTGFARIACDEDSDCTNGEVCWASDGGGSSSASVSCESADWAPLAAARRVCKSPSNDEVACPAGEYCGRPLDAAGASVLPPGWMLCQPASHVTCGATACDTASAAPACCTRQNTTTNEVTFDCSTLGECVEIAGTESASVACEAHGNCPAGQLCWEVDAGGLSANTQCQPPDFAPAMADARIVCASPMMPEQACPAGEDCLPATNVAVGLPSPWKLCQ